MALVSVSKIRRNVPGNCRRTVGRITAAAGDNHINLGLNAAYATAQGFDEPTNNFGVSLNSITGGGAEDDFGFVYYTGLPADATGLHFVEVIGK